MDIIISNSSGEPIYHQIINQMKTHIVSGEMTEGERLPSIRQLAKDLRISTITTKKAYEELEAKKFIQSIPGKGTFVALQNRELIAENQLRQIKEKLAEAIKYSKLLDISLEEMTYILKYVYEDIS